MLSDRDGPGLNDASACAEVVPPKKYSLLMPVFASIEKHTYTWKRSLILIFHAKMLIDKIIYQT